MDHQLCRIVDGYLSLQILARNAMGRLSVDEQAFIPPVRVAKVFFVARIHMAIYAAALGSALYFGHGCR